MCHDRCPCRRTRWVERVWLGVDVNYIHTHWKRWQKCTTSLFNAMIVCAICEFTNNICRYDPAVSDHHDFSGFQEAKVDDADLTWEKSSAPHIKPYIHQAYSGNGHYQCSVCKSCANELQTRKEHIVHYRQSYVFAILNKCSIGIHACIIHCEYSSESYDTHIWMILSWHGVSTWH